MPAILFLLNEQYFKDEDSLPGVISIIFVIEFHKLVP